MIFTWALCALNPSSAMSDNGMRKPTVSNTGKAPRWLRRDLTCSSAVVLSTTNFVAILTFARLWKFAFPRFGYQPSPNSILLAEASSYM